MKTAREHGNELARIYASGCVMCILASILFSVGAYYTGEDTLTILNAALIPLPFGLLFYMGYQMMYSDPWTLTGDQ